MERALRRTFAITDNQAAMIKPATTCGADFGSVSEESVLQAGLATRLDKSLVFEKHHKQRIFMKRFILTIAIVLPLFFFAACGPSKSPEANPSAASPAATAATITASPNPVTTGEGPGYYDDSLEYRRRHFGPSLCFGGWRTRNTFCLGSTGVCPSTLDPGGEKV